MTFEESLQYLDGVIRAGIKYDLNNIRRILDLLNHPERFYPVVSVTGTNGKGSVCAFLESILTEAGYSVGLNTSPHLVSPRERLRINRMISNETAFAEAITTIRNIVHSGWHEHDPGRPTFFETMTSAALHYFREKKVDIALMEAGLGGRLDGTNATQPLLSIITRIGIDHPRTLGNTHSKIAFEKFGLARNNKPLLIAKQKPSVTRLFNHLAQFRGSRAVFVESEWRKSGDGLILTTNRSQYIRIRLGIPGKYQLENAACAVVAAELLKGHGFICNEKAVRSGLAKAFWPGRMELKTDEPRILMDGSHNPDGMRHFIVEMKKIPAKRRILIATKVGQRSPDKTLGRLLPLVDRVFLPPLSVGRAIDPDELASQLRKHHNHITVSKSVEEAWLSAREEYRAGDLIIVAGSLYLVGAFKAVIGDTLDSPR